LRLLKLINLHIDKYIEEELIEQLTVKYQKIQYTLTNLPIVKQKLKLTQKMALKGLSTTTIHEILKNLEYDEDIDDAFEKDLNKIKSKTNNENKIIHKLLMLGYTYDYIKRHIDV
jgi:SOS response regulatory protein OraA/RecX